MAAPQEVASGSQLAVVGTTHTLYTPSAAGAYRLVVELPAAFVATEFVELAALLKTLTGSTLRVAHPATYEGTGVARVAYGLIYDAAHANGISFTLRQTSGSGRTFPWSVWARF